jgi:hypothetical protein
LTLPREQQQCHPLNAEVMGQWNSHIQAGNAMVELFPLQKVKMPPPEGRAAGAASVPRGRINSSPNPGTPNGLPNIQFFGCGPPPGFGNHAVPSPFQQHITVPATPLRNTPTADFSLQSSPIRAPSEDYDPDAELDGFITWYLDRHGGPRGGWRAVEIRRIGKILQDEFMEVHNLPKMTPERWQALQVPMNFALGLGKEAKRYLKASQN